MGDNSEPRKPTVLLTGFGPFGSHVVNASWVAVKEVNQQGLGNDVKLVVEEIPVVYDTVSSQIPKLWAKYKPDLVVHVGVSSVADGITLEQQAHNDGYDKLDVKGTYPCRQQCVESNPTNCLISSIDMQRVCESVNHSCPGVTTVVSQDPGRYLCDFIYFTSLNVDCSRTAFIHVPPLNKPYNAQQLAIGIRYSIQAMLKQLEQKHV